MARTYLYGYNPVQRLTLDELGQRVAWWNLDPEFRRRLLAMFDHGQEVGRDVGIGGGWRSSAQQEQVFRQRYHVVACPGSIQWNGQCWNKNPGVAPSAPPGRSYHETTTSNGAIAADLIGDIAWADTIAALFGLRSLADLLPPNNELWHHQPLEVPTARRYYDGAPLRRWPLPVPEVPTPSGRIIDMYGITYRLDRWPGPHLDRVGLDSIEHAQDGNSWAIDQAEPGAMAVKELDREEYKSMLRDRGRRHVSVAPDGTNTQDPFGAAYEGGAYADLELSELWRAQQRD